jgi:hypothetical protein
MHPGFLRGGLIPSIGLLVACGASKPSAPTVEIPVVGDTVSTSLSDISYAVWLGEKRWAIIAPAEETVGLVDVARRTVAPLGKRGSKDLRNPANLFAAQDTLYVDDWGLRRITLWAPPNHLARTVPAPAVTRGTLPRARDAAGRYYFDLYPSPGPDGSGNRDSAAVVRADPGLTRIDTIARLAPLDIAEVVGDAGRRFERRIFSGMDHWGILPDGSLWLARVYDNRVDWRSPEGKWTKGGALPDRVLEVTRYDRELFLRKFPPELRRTAQDLPFAALKPPFEAGLTRASGEVWLEKSRAPADSSRRYQVVNRTGQLVEEVRVPGQGRILGLAGNAALIGEITPQGTRLVNIILPARLSFAGGTTSPISGAP